MYQHLMPPTNNPRKRPAPGTPVSQALPVQQPYNAASQMSNEDFLKWNSSAEDMAFSAPPAYNMNYNGATATQPQFDSSVPASSTQLTRRPIVSRQLIPPAQRAQFDNSVDPWGQFGDESILDPMGNPSAMEENDNIELLEERAVGAKRDAQSKRKQIPPFVQKLSSFLDDGKNTELIRWSQRGDSFVVLDEDEFAKTLIPELFKHNNYASFVRQLNMYGFHKRVGLSDNSMKASERKNKSPSEYYNPYFKRGHPNLLWLINKPKGGHAKTKSKSRVKTENVIEEMDSDDDGRDGVEEMYGPSYSNVQPTRAISVVPESGSLQRKELAVVQREISEIQKQQAMVLSRITRLQAENNKHYQQAVAFQQLHDRHESSINAILTFLATIYNRSLDGENPGGIAQMFAQAIPQHQQQQQQGSVVDMGDVSNQTQQPPGSASPVRRHQRLLMAPPDGGRASTVSSASTPQPQYQSSDTPRPGDIEELFDSPSADTPHMKVEPEIPQQDMMSLIHNTNATASNTNGNNAMEFPELLSHYENANGNSPLTTQQRNNMLSMIASQTSTPGSNNALISPVPPPPNPQVYRDTEAQINQLLALQNDNHQRIQRLNRAVSPMSPAPAGPLSPSAGLNGGDASYFTDPIMNGNLDLDQYLDPSAFYNGNSPGPGQSAADYSFNFADTDPDSAFDLNMDGANDARIEPLESPSPM